MGGGKKENESKLNSRPYQDVAQVPAIVLGQQQPYGQHIPPSLFLLQLSRLSPIVFRSHFDSSEQEPSFLELLRSNSGILERRSSESSLRSGRIPRPMEDGGVEGRVCLEVEAGIEGRVGEEKRDQIGRRA